MNKRNLALLISKHPLLRKLTEDKTIPKSIVARLIVEELMETQELEEAPAKPKDNIATKVRNYVNRMLKSNASLMIIQNALVRGDVKKQWLAYIKEKAGGDQKIERQLSDWLEKSIEKHYNRASKAIALQLAKGEPEKEQAKKELAAVNKEAAAQDAAIGQAEQKLDTPPGKEQQKLGEKIVDNIFNSSDLSEYLNNYADGVDIFAVKYPEYYEKRKLEPKEYAANFKKEIKSLINDKQYLDMFKDENKRENLVKLIRSLYKPKISSFGTKDGREDLMKRLVPLVFEYWETPQDTKQKDDTFNSLDLPKYGNIIKLALREYKKVPIGELDDDAKLVVALTHRYFDNRALEEQIDPKKIFLGALGKMVGATKELPSKTYEDFMTFLDYAGKKIKKEEYQDGSFFKILSYVMEDTDVRSEVQEYITGTKPFQSDKKPLEAPAQKIVDNIASVVVDIDAEEKFLTTADQNEPSVALDLVSDKLPEEQVDALKTAPEDKKEEIVKAVADKLAVARQELDIEPIAKKFGEYEYFEPLSDEQKQVMFKFIALLKRNKLFENFTERTSLIQVLKKLNVGSRGNMEVLLQYMTEEEQQTVQKILSNQNTDVDKFLAMLKKAELAPVDKEPGKEEKPSTPMKGEPVAIDPAQAEKFVEAANALINDFYNQKYRINQAKLVNGVITAMKEFVEDKDLALAFGKPPSDEPAPEEQEATSEKPPEEQTAEPLEEQEGEEIKADKDEMRNIRIGLRSFLSRVNKAKKFLEEFEEVAKDGSVLSDAYKKRFIDNLKEIQTAIYRIALVLNKMLSDKEQLNEKKGSETIKKWKEVQKLYDLSIKSVSSVKELLDTETPPDELDSMLTNDAYSALIGLAGHFPSVAPFGAGKMKRSEFGEYKIKFTNAIGQLKSDLQNVFNLVKTGEAGEESLQNAREGLRDFGDAIASIFGVPSRFKDAKVKPGDDKEPAVQEDPEAEDMSDFPRDLPTQIKDFLGEYRGKYERVKSVLDKGIFKEGIGEDFEDLKAAFLQADKMVGHVTKDYTNMMRAASEQNIPSEETNKLVGDLLRRFVALYEELMSLYKRATDNPSIWQKMWKTITSKFNELKNAMSKIYKEILGPLEIDLDLNPSDFEIRDISEPEDQGKERPGETEVEEEFQFSNIKDIRTQLTSKKADIERIKKLLAKADGIDGDEEIVNKYYEAFLLWYLMLNEKEATSLQEVFLQKIPINTREKTTEEKYKKTLQKLKVSSEEYFETIKDFHLSLPPTTVQKFYQTFETVFEDEEINIAIDKTFIKTFSKRLKLPEKTEPGEEEGSSSLIDDILAAAEKEKIEAAAAEAVKNTKEKSPDIADDDLIAQALEDVLAEPEIQDIVDTQEEKPEDVEKEVEKVVSKKANPKRNSIADYKKLKKESDELQRRIWNFEKKYSQDKSTENYKFFISGPQGVEAMEKKKEKIDKQIQELANEMGLQPKKSKNVKTKTDLKTELDKAKKEVKRYKDRLEKENRKRARGKGSKKDVEFEERMLKDAQEKLQKLQKQKRKTKGPELKDAGALDPNFNPSRPGAPLEEQISKKLKPLIREILTKGK
jgi:hypothetical protein